MEKLLSQNQQVLDQKILKLYRFYFQNIVITAQEEPFHIL